MIARAMSRGFSFLIRAVPNVRFWHLADIRGIATFCPLLDKSGQITARAENAIDDGTD
jgi:hypothetical protein